MTCEHMNGSDVDAADLIIEELRAEIAKEREKVAQLACAPSRICKVPMLEVELAAAQATIEQMREAAPVVPDGMVLVPREPTEKMLNSCWRDYPETAVATWKAMIAAAQEQCE